MQVICCGNLDNYPSTNLVMQIFFTARHNKLGEYQCKLAITIKQNQKMYHFALTEYLTDGRVVIQSWIWVKKWPRGNIIIIKTAFL